MTVYCKSKHGRKFSTSALIRNRFNSGKLVFCANIVLIAVLAFGVGGNIILSNKAVASAVGIEGLQDDFNNMSGMNLAQSNEPSTDMDVLLTYVRDNGMVESTDRDILLSTPADGVALLDNVN